MTLGMGMGMGAGTVQLARAKAGGNCVIYQHRCDPTSVRVVIGADAIEVVGLPVLLTYKYPHLGLYLFSLPFLQLRTRMSAHRREGGGEGRDIMDKDTTAVVRRMWRGMGK